MQVRSGWEPRIRALGKGRGIKVVINGVRVTLRNLEEGHCLSTSAVRG